MKTPSLAVAAALAALGPLAMAHWMDDQGSYIPEDDWPLWNRYWGSPNASNSVPIAGYDVSEPYSNNSASLTPKNWTAFIELAADVPFEVVIPNDEDDERLWLGVRVGVTYTADDEKNNETDSVDDSWAACMSATQLRFLRTEDVPSGNDTINPTCEGVLHKDCIAWLRDFSDAGMLCRNDVLLSRKYEKYDIRESPCNDHHNFGFGLEGIAFNNVTNITAAPGLASAFRPRDYDVGDMEFYDRWLGSVWLVMVGWGPAEKMERGYYDLDLDVVNGSMVCLRADDLSPGSRTLDEAAADAAAEEDAAVGTAMQWKTATGVAAGVAALLTIM